MSQGKNDDKDSRTSDNGRAAQLTEMLFKGRSFSGHERNCCFLNTLGAGRDGDRFATISAISGVDFEDDGRGMAQVDWDHDGDLDLWISNRTAPRLRLLRNDSPDGNRFVEFQLVGNGRDTNRDAIGARVEVVLTPTNATDGAKPPVRSVRTLRAGEGFLSQSSQWLHFGLGESAEIARVLVSWPNAEHTAEEFAAVRVNGRYRLAQGSGEAQSSADRGAELALQPTTTQVPVGDSRHRILLNYPLNVSPMGYFGFDGTLHEIDFKPGRSTFINIWSATCKPCVAELQEFSRRAAELEAAGIDVIAMSIDALESSPSEGVAMAKEMAERLQLPFAVGMAPPAVTDELQELHDITITYNRPMPMPSSFLINSEGQLTMIYKGPVDTDTLLADSRIGELDVLARFQQSAAFPGTMLDDSVVNDSMIHFHSMRHYKRAHEFMAYQNLDAAAHEYDMLLKYNPDSGSILSDRAVFLLMKGKVGEALVQLRRASELSPDDPKIQYVLAQALDQQGKSVEARQILEHAVVRFPDFANSHFLLGALKMRARDVTGAKASWEQAIRADPNHARTRSALTDLAIQAGDLASAKKHLEAMLESNPDDPGVLLGLGTVFMREKNWPSAEKQFRKALQVQPKLAAAHFQLGLALAAQKKYAEAQQHFAATLQLEPNYPGAREALEQSMHVGVSSK